MNTEAQKARNARKRAKLKLHKKQAIPWRDIVGPGWFVIAVSRRERKLWISWTHTIYVVGEGNPWVAGHNSWHPAYQSFLDKVVTKLGDQECDPDSVSVQLYRTWLPDSYGGWLLRGTMEDLIDLRLDLIDRLRKQN